MTTINYVLHDGSVHSVDANNGDSVMIVAVRNDFEGILAECGGACSCATCHVHVAPEWIDKLPEMDDLEREMLDFAARHGVGAQVETLPMSEVNTALDRLRRNDVRYRFVLSRE